MTFLRQFLAIAVLTVRRAVRTRVFQYTFGLVALAVISLPLLITSDGTVENHARIAIEYTIRLLTFVLAVTSLWAAVDASSREIGEKQIHLLVTKPVSAVQIWLGKWLGLLAINAVLILLAGICISAMLRWNLRASQIATLQRRAAAEEVLTARESLNPMPPPDREAKVLRRVKELTAGTKPGLLSEDGLLEGARRDVMRAESTVQPCSSQTWVFDVGNGGSGNRQLFIRYLFSSLRQLDLKPVAVQWHIFDSKGGTVTNLVADVFAGRPNSFAISFPAGSGTLTAEFLNAQTNPPAIVVFNRTDGINVLVPCGSFEGNLARALIMLFCKLAILSALGLTMGCIFSMPVAVFVACATIAVFNLTALIASTDIAQDIHRRQPGRRGVINAIVDAKFRAADALCAPIRRYDPVPSLQKSEAIPWSLVGRAVVVEVVLYSGILGMLGVFILKRRQLGMPAE